MKYLRFAIFSQRGSERKAARFCALQRVYQSIEYREPHDGSKIYSERDGYDVSQFEFLFFFSFSVAVDVFCTSNFIRNTSSLNDFSPLLFLSREEADLHY